MMWRLVLVVVCVVMRVDAVSGAAVKVMALGDSITEGSDGGYRSRMASGLIARGVEFEFVGSRVTQGVVPAVLNTPSRILHEGHGGFRIDQLSANLFGVGYVDAGNPHGNWLSGGGGSGRGAVYPDVITYMAGINDINQNYGAHQAAGTMMSEGELLPILKGRTEILVNKILTNRPGATLLISNLIPFANGLLDSRVTGEWPRALNDPLRFQDIRVNHYVMVFNAWLEEEYVPSLKAAGKKVGFVDQYSNFINADGSVVGWGQGPGDGYADYGLHPNQRGYDLMGATWAEAVASVVPEPSVLWVMGVGLAGVRRRR